MITFAEPGVCPRLPDFLDSAPVLKPVLNRIRETPVEIRSLKFKKL
jgi:hypothetical protein